MVTTVLATEATANGDLVAAGLVPVPKSRRREMQGRVVCPVCRFGSLDESTDPRVGAEPKEVMWNALSDQANDHGSLLVERSAGGAFRVPCGAGPLQGSTTGVGKGGQVGGRHIEAHHLPV